ncbi:MAG: helicase-exonuclease AddAB subunit AddB [Firmicutes bacterium]|nr:helicase-exonuclease AddAB subunit AddB [Bacillota bacterium]
MVKETGEIIMSVRFMLGRAGSGKTFTCLETIAQMSKEKPMGAPLILLVPEQASFEMEKELAQLCGGGTFRAQVLSFRRLADRFLQSSGSQRPVITELGRQLLLRRLLQEQTPVFTVFERAARQPRFCEQLASQLREFKHYQVTTESLATLASSTDCPPALRGKLQDLATIYAAYHDYTQDQYTDPEDTLTQLATAVSAGWLPAETRVWVDGFAGFTPQEFAVLSALFSSVAHTEIALCLDPHTVQRPREEDLFHPTQDTYWRLRRLAGETAVKALPPLVLPQTIQPTRFTDSPALTHLEENLAIFPVRPYTAKTSDLKLVTTAGNRAEVEAVARDILHLVREKGWRYRDIGIILRNFSTYHDVVSAIFLDYDIPFYVDERRLAAHHPLVEFLRSALETVVSHFSAQPVIQLLKTDFFPLTREAVDQVENYVRLHGIRGSRWLDDEPWLYRLQLALAEEDEERSYDNENDNVLTDARNCFKQLFAPFAQALGGGRKIKAAACCQQLWELLERVDVSTTLQQWSQAAEAEGLVNSSQEHRQVWQGVVELLEQTVAILGDQPMTLPEFMQVFLSGLESLTLGLVPATTDRVVIGNVERSRHPRLLATYVLGLSEGDFPARLQEEGLFADEERESLGQAGVELAVTRRQRLFHEQYLSYIALTRSSEYLWVSCPLADDEGKAKRPSSLFNRVRELFAHNEVFFFGNTPEAVEDYHAVAEPQKIAAVLLQQAGHVVGGGTFSPFWATVYNEALANHATFTSMKTLWPALTYNNYIPPLQPATVEAFFGKNLRSSVSRLEKFAQCPFAHFAHYGLRLVEQQAFSVEAPDMGMFFHAALRTFVEQLLEEEITWSNLTLEEAVTRMDAVVDELVPQLHREILLSSARLRFLATRLKETLAQAIRTLTIHAQQSQFHPVAVELSFGGRGLPPWQLTSRDTTILLHGQIDRVDVAEVEQQIYYRIIDYKSSPTTLKLSDLWHGLSLQLMAYLNVINDNMAYFSRKDGMCAGALYFGIYRPYERVANPKPETTELTDIPKLDGLMVADRDVLALMGGAKLVHAAIKKDGSFTKASRVANHEQMQQLRQYLNDKMSKLASRILQGSVEVTPYKKPDGRRACTYCPFTPLCCFDVTVEGNQYRHLSQFSSEQVLQSIAAQQEGGTHHG